MSDDSNRQAGATKTELLMAITQAMRFAGIAALADSREEGLSEGDTACQVYAAMRAAELSRRS